MRRISARREISDSVVSSRTSRRSACCKRSGSCSLFAPKVCAARAVAAVATASVALPCSTGAVDGFACCAGSDAATCSARVDERVFVIDLCFREIEPSGRTKTKKMWHGVAGYSRRPFACASRRRSCAAVRSPANVAMRDRLIKNGALASLRTVFLS